METFFNSYFSNHFWQALSPDNDKLKQGVQKCHKTIKDALSNANVFHAEGTETLFLILRKTTELRSSEIGRYKYQGRGGNDSGNVVGLHQILGMLKVYLYLTYELGVKLFLTIEEDINFHQFFFKRAKDPRVERPSINL